MIKLNDTIINVGKFPNNESFIDVELSKEIKKENKCTIYFKFEDDSEFIYLKFLKDFLSDNFVENITLLMPYIPYSRMDRKEENRLFTLKSIAKFINELNFKKVIVWEPHSNVSTALFDRLVVVNKSAEITWKLLTKLSEVASDSSIMEKYDDPYIAIKEECKKRKIFLVYPDDGAAKRYNKQFDFENIITCQKERDFNTGRIKSLKLECPDKIKIDTAVIVDDLSSRGGTFQYTAKELKEQLGVENIYLVVTHCENTIFDGEVLTGGLIKMVYTTDSIIDTERANACENITLM